MDGKWSEPLPPRLTGSQLPPNQLGSCWCQTLARANRRTELTHTFCFTASLSSLLQVNFKIGRACEQCPRGALAARAFAKGDVVASLPGSAALELGDGSTAEQAYRLLERLEHDEAFSKAWAPFVASLPQPDEIFGPEMFSDAHLAELQTSELVS